MNRESPLPTVCSAEQSYPLGTEMLGWMRDLFPLHRAQTGVGVRKTLRYLQHHLPLEIHEVASGTTVFDWTIPEEWHIRDAFIADSKGQRIVDYRQCNLHVASNSQPVCQQLSYAELEPHLHWLTEPPSLDTVPYRTMFFRQEWGFCVSQRMLDRLKTDPAEKFTVVIDATFSPGSLSYGEAILPGQSRETILLYAHCCHPSLANDNLSGIVVATMLGKQLVKRAKQQPLRRTYRIVFAPATIGAITWLAANQADLPQVYAGLILTLLGSSGPFIYKKSRRGATVIDRAIEVLWRELDNQGRTIPFAPWGYDERQFGAPGFDLPVGCLMRTTPSEFSEYHTSADNLEKIQAQTLQETLKTLQQLLTILESNDLPVNQSPFGEPRLGPRGLYRPYGADDSLGRFQEAVLWILNLADGDHDLLDICQQGQLPWKLVSLAAEALRQQGLIKSVD